jgi:hypothetical protein
MIWCVAIGQKAIVTLDSYKGEVLKRSLIKFFQLWMPVPAPLKLKHILQVPVNYPNLTAEANIIIQTKENTITIPRSYLVDNDYVIVNNDEKSKK